MTDHELTMEEFGPHDQGVNINKVNICLTEHEKEKLMCLIVDYQQASISVIEGMGLVDKYRKSRDEAFQQIKELIGYGK